MVCDHVPPTVLAPSTTVTGPDTESDGTSSDTSTVTTLVALSPSESEATTPTVPSACKSSEQ